VNAGELSIQQQDSAERAFNKLARTFAAQVEALKRYRTGGQQKVTVEHESRGDSAKEDPSMAYTASTGLKKSYYPLQHRSSEKVG
jgi:hypothetical protein